MYLFCLPQCEPRMDSRKILVLIAGTFYIICKKTAWIGTFVKTRNRIILKFQHVHQAISRLYCFAELVHYSCSNYTPLLISLYSTLSSWYRHMQNTMGTSVWSCFCTEELDDSFLGSRTLHFIMPSISIQSGESLHPRNFRVTQRNLFIFTNVGYNLISYTYRISSPCLFLYHVLVASVLPS
jgi:hypothetical protein